jgi:hypothetical protein
MNQTNCAPPLRRGATLLWLLMLCTAAFAEAPPPASAPAAPAPAAGAAPAAAPKASASDSGKCSSVVMRNCRARFVPEPPAEGITPSKGGDPRGRWEAVRVADLDSGEIVVEESRERDPAVQEVFDRYLRSGADAYLTRNAAGGARCTTIASSGATFCSRPGMGTPDSGLPRSDFSDAVF